MKEQYSNENQEPDYMEDTTEELPRYEILDPENPINYEE